MVSPLLSFKTEAEEWPKVTLVSSFLIYFIYTAIHIILFSSACMSTFFLFSIHFILPITPFCPPNHSFLFIIESEQPFHLDSYWTLCSLLSFFSVDLDYFFLTFHLTIDYLLSSLRWIFLFYFPLHCRSPFQKSHTFLSLRLWLSSARLSFLFFLSLMTLSRRPFLFFLVHLTGACFLFVLSPCLYHIISRLLRPTTYPVPLTFLLLYPINFLRYGGYINDFMAHHCFFIYSTTRPSIHTLKNDLHPSETYAGKNKCWVTNNLIRLKGDSTRTEP